MNSACPDCKGSGRYQPLLGPAEDCRTCFGAGELVYAAESGKAAWFKMDGFSPPGPSVVLRLALQCAKIETMEIIRDFTHTINKTAMPGGWNADTLFFLGCEWIERDPINKTVDLLVDVRLAPDNPLKPNFRLADWRRFAWQFSPECELCPACGRMVVMQQNARSRYCPACP